MAGCTCGRAAAALVLAGGALLAVLAAQGLGAPQLATTPDGRITVEVDSMGAIFLTAIVEHFRGNPDQARAVRQLAADGGLAGQVYLVTGATRGLGRSIATRLLASGARVVAASRTVRPGLPAALVAEARALVEAEGLPTAVVGAAEAMALDLADLGSVAAFVATAARRKLVFDCAVLNAGVHPSSLRRTAQGYEHAFGINFLGNFALATGLVDAGLVRGADGEPGRIVVVSSEAHRVVPSLDLNHLHIDGGFSLATAGNFYGHSKLLLTTAALEMRRRFEAAGVAVTTICPGAVATAIAKDSPYGLSFIVDVLMYVACQPADKAAVPVATVAALPHHYRGAGAAPYHFMQHVKPARTDAADEALGSAVWDAATTLIRSHAAPA